MLLEDKLIVGLYIRGADLDPDLVTKRLGIVPSRSQQKGETEQRLPTVIT